MFDYAFDSRVNIGQVVRVPFGRRILTGVVWNVGNAEVKEVKPLEGIIENIQFSPEFCTFLARMATYTFTPLNKVLHLTGVDKYIPIKEKIVYITQDGQLFYSKKQLKRVSSLSSYKIDKAIQSRDIHVQWIPDYFITKSHQSFQFVKKITLSAEQTSAMHALQSAFTAHKPIVLSGLTSSGKTLVYIQAVYDVIAQGGQVLILLPEIGLTTHLINRFERQLGVNIAVWHSKISSTKKRAIWHGILNGETLCVVGARSALFLPYKKLQVIVVDESHDESYKQEEGIIYNARDMAVLRGKCTLTSVVLSTATPSLETWVNVRHGKYENYHLQAPYFHTHVETSILDMRSVKTLLHPQSEKAIQNALNVNAQSLVFLNRRGYANYMVCTHCGHTVMCPHCSVTLTYHYKNHGHEKYLLCHICGYATTLPENCPECNAPNLTRDQTNDLETHQGLKLIGYGVEQMAEYIIEKWPNARVELGTSDSLSSYESMINFLEKMNRNELDIVVGTRLLSKGFHWPNLRTIVVADADMNVLTYDLRAKEKAFQLIQQVKGRGGREQDGFIALQTYNPTQAVLKAIVRGEDNAFLDSEYRQRKIGDWPPVGRLIALIVLGQDEKKLWHFAETFFIPVQNKYAVELLGPVEAPIYKIRNQYRVRFLIKGKRVHDVHSYVTQLMYSRRVPNGIQIKIDVDPYTFF